MICEKCGHEKDVQTETVPERGPGWKCSRCHWWNWIAGAERPLYDYIDLEAYDVVTGPTHRDLQARLDKALAALRSLESMAGAAGAGETPAMPLAKLARDAIAEIEGEA